ncbi:MAG: DUF3489 domain-containing protein [Rhizobiaceae bacterium]
MRSKASTRAYIAVAGRKPTNPTVQSKRVTKKDQLIKLLRAKRGMDICAISQKLGWQQHTTRAALTRLRQAGYVLNVVKADNSKPTRYRITADSSATNLTHSQVMSDA